MTRSLPPRRRWLGCLVASTALLLPACGWDGHLNILGYTTRPNYDPSIHTVYVNMGTNATMRRGLEFQLTQALVREIEMKTPWKVSSDRSCADTELAIKIVTRPKSLTIFNQLGETRDAQLMLNCEVIWRDLRPGKDRELISNQPPGRPQDPVPVGPPLTKGPPVIVQAMARYTPELGLSTSTGEQDLVNQVATQVVQMMEKPW